MTPENQELVTQHQALVHSIAKKVKGQMPQVIEYEELVSYGQEGLIQAARRFDPERGAVFSTFAYYRIRGAMFDGVRRMGPMVRLSTRARFEEKADQYLEQRSTEPAPNTAVDAAERLSSMISDLAVAYVMASEKIGESADHTTPDPAEVTEAREGISLIRERLSHLPDKEKDLLRLMYFEDYTMQAAAEELGISKGWASRLHTRALAKLRKETVDPPRAMPMIRV